MPKGKKFDAAEKHFAKERKRLDEQIKSLRSQLESVHKDTRIFRERAEFYERENEELKAWIERLLEYTELSKEDIKKACEKDKRAADALEWLSKWGGLSQFLR